MGNQAIFTRNMRVTNWVLLVALIASFPLSAILPQWLGWENGVLEDIQAVILLGGMLMAAWAAWQQKGSISAPLWWIAMPFWLVFLGRELAWGAAFLDPIGQNQWGPTISSRVLWYRPAVPWICTALLLLCIYWMLRHRVFSRVLVRIQQERAWPWFGVLIFALNMIASTNAEGHGFMRFQDWLGTQVVVLEELVETIGYLALVLAQWALIRQTATWRTPRTLN